MTTQQTAINPLLGISTEESRRISRERLDAVLCTLNPKQQKYITEVVPSTSQRLFADAFAGSKAKATKAMCLSCSNFQRDEITYCTVLTCPLHTVRPFQSKSGKDEQEDKDDES